MITTSKHSSVTIVPYGAVMSVYLLVCVLTELNFVTKSNQKSQKDVFTSFLYITINLNGSPAKTCKQLLLPPIRLALCSCQLQKWFTNTSVNIAGTKYATDFLTVLPRIQVYNLEAKFLSFLSTFFMQIATCNTRNCGLEHSVEAFQARRRGKVSGKNQIINKMKLAVGNESTVKNYAKLFSASRSWIC